MTRHSFRSMALAALAAFGMLTFTAQPSYARTTDQGGLRNSMIDSGDRMESKDVSATSSPVVGQRSVTVTETLHYINEPFLFWKHSTQYQIKRSVSASYVDRVGYFVVHDNEGDWYQLNVGSPSAVRLGGKPQASIGAQNSVIDGNDRSALAGVTAGGVNNGTPQLNVTYNYSHAESLDDVHYSVTGPVNTTFVSDQNAYFAWIGSSLFRIDSAGHVAQLNDKPSVDRGTLNNEINGNDSRDTYPDVIARGGLFVVTWGYVHEDTFEHVHYATQEQVRADYVPETNSYMAWIDSVEYQNFPGTNRVDRLSQRPVIQLGQRQLSLINDRSYRTDVYSVSNKDVVIRAYFHRNETYVAKEYYVERPGVLYYNQNWAVWMVAIDGQSYVVDFDSDSFNDPSVQVLHAPAGSTRPQYSVPSTSGDGLPPAVVPGRDPNGGNTPPANNSNGIPGRAPSGIPGRTPPPAATCIPGRC